MILCMTEKISVRSRDHRTGYRGGRTERKYAVLCYLKGCSVVEERSLVVAAGSHSSSNNFYFRLGHPRGLFFGRPVYTTVAVGSLKSGSLILPPFHALSYDDIDATLVH